MMCEMPDIMRAAVIGFPSVIPGLDPGISCSGDLRVNPEDDAAHRADDTRNTAHRIPNLRTRT